MRTQHTLGTKCTMIALKAGLDSSLARWVVPKCAYRDPSSPVTQPCAKTQCAADGQPLIMHSAHDPSKGGAPYVQKCEHA